MTSATHFSHFWWIKLTKSRAKTSSHTVKCSQTLLEAAGNSHCKSRVRWVKTQGQERHHQKSKAWFLLLWWKGLLFASLCLLGWAVKWVNTTLGTEQVWERATTIMGMKESSQQQCSQCNWSSASIPSYPSSVLCCLSEEGKKGHEDKFDLYLHSHYVCWKYD